jgi:N-acetylmuramoyl-L-alanine amidase
LINNVFLIIFVLINISPLYSEFTVAIDIGHTPDKPGAISSRGVGEYSYNYAMAIALKNEFSKKNIKSFIVNMEGEEISLKDRIRISEKLNADIFISIHHDSVQRQYLKRWNFNGKENSYCNKFSGYSIFVSRKNPFFKKSSEIAKLVSDNLLSSGFNFTMYHAENIHGENKKLLYKDRGVYIFDNLVVLKYSKIPSILIECGIIVNKNDEKTISKDNFRMQFSKSIADAIKYYKNSNR